MIVPNKQETATAPAPINNSMLMIIPPKDIRFRKTNHLEFWLAPMHFIQLKMQKSHQFHKFKSILNCVITISYILEERKLFDHC